MSNEHLDAAVADWLVTDDGLAAVARTARSLRSGADVLQIGTRLRRDGVAHERASATVAAAVARERARARWHDADRLLFTREALEQASDPAVSRWRARRFADDEHVEDRAAGCGGDTMALAEVVGHVTAIDVDAARLTLLRHNLAVRGSSVETVVADALVHPPPTTGAVHVDPARRVDGRRVRRLADHRPSVPGLLDHLADVGSGPGLGVVLGPGVDLDDRDLPSDAEVEFVQIGGHLVEAVLWTGDLRGREVRATATLLDDTPPTATGDVPLVATRSRGDRPPRVGVGAVGSYLIEVAPAAVRARVHDELAAEIGARRIAERRALLTADELPVRSPWYRCRPVEAVLAPRADAVRRHLLAVDERPVEVVLHGIDVDVADFRRQLRGIPSGPGGRRVELVRTDGGAVAIVTGQGGGP